MFFIFFSKAVPDVFAQSFLDSEDRLHRFTLKSLNLKSSGCREFLGYRPSLLDSAPCDYQRSFQRNVGAFLSLSFIDNQQPKRKLIGSFPEEFSVFHESFYFGSQGEPRAEGASAMAELSVKLMPIENLGFEASVLGLHELDQGQLSARIQKLSLEWGFRSLILSLGRQPIYWGQSFVNPILIGESAQNMDMLRLSTRPIRWGSFFRHLGDLKAEFFLSRMEENRATPRDWLMGWRVGLMPTDDFEINFSYLYQFGGEKVPEINWLEFMFELIGTRLKRSAEDWQGSDHTNRAGSMDLRWRFHQGRWPSAFYTEHHLEDCCGSFKVVFEKSYNYLYGLESLVGDLWGRPLLQLEYVKTTFALYRHHRWKSGLSRHGMLMGHPIGRDSQGVYFFAKTTAFSLWSFGISALWEEILRTGRSSDTSYLASSARAVSENHWGVSPLVQWQFHPQVRLDTQSAFILVKNRNFQRTPADWNWLVGFRIHAEIF